MIDPSTWMKMSDTFCGANRAVSLPSIIPFSQAVLMLSSKESICTYSTSVSPVNQFDTMNRFLALQRSKWADFLSDSDFISRGEDTACKLEGRMCLVSIFSFKDMRRIG